MKKFVSVFLLLMTGCVTHGLSAGTLVDLLIPVTISIPTKNLNDYWVLCGVPASSCNASAPLTITDAREPYEINDIPALSAVDVIHRVSLDVLESGYITFMALDAVAVDHIVIGLRSGVVNVGDPWPFATPESQLAADVLAGDAPAVARIRSFFNANLSAFPQIDGNGKGSGGVLYRFSDASLVGSIGPITATPEPSSGTFMVVGVLALVSSVRTVKLRRGGTVN